MEQLVEADLKRVLDDLRGQLDRGDTGETGFLEDQKALREDAEKNIQNLREAFRIASNGEIQERVSPSKLAQSSDTNGVGCPRLSRRRHYL